MLGEGAETLVLVPVAGGGGGGWGRSLRGHDGGGAIATSGSGDDLVLALLDVAVVVEVVGVGVELALAAPAHAAEGLTIFNTHAGGVVVGEGDRGRVSLAGCDAVVDCGNSVDSSDVDQSRVEEDTTSIAVHVSRRRRVGDVGARLGLSLGEANDQHGRQGRNGELHIVV